MRKQVNKMMQVMSNHLRKAVMMECKGYGVVMGMMSMIMFGHDLVCKSEVTITSLAYGRN